MYGDGSTESYRYRADGALLEARNAAATVGFTRDVLGNVLEEQQNGHTVSSTLDRAGQRIGLTSSLGAEVSYRHGALGAVEEMKAGGGWQASFARDGQGLELHRYYSGGLRTSWQRDALGRPVEQRIGAGGRPTAGPARHSERVRTYGWQENDRLSSIDDSTLGATRYAHDAVGNLAATLFADGLEQLRTPDAVGNLFHTAGRTDRRYGPAGQLLEAGGTRYAYDEAGNLKQRTLPTGEQWHYTWNAAGHLAEVVRPDGGVVRFAYDALGRRVSKSYRGRVTRWVWDGNQPLHEWTELELDGANTDEVITWLFEPDSFAPLAKLQGQQRQSIVCDHLGTPLQMHDGQGQLSWAMELDSYGAVRKQRGEAGACPFRYQGQYEDQKTGLYYNRFRYYDPETGQYISQDPIGLAGGWALHAYVADPLTQLDVFGLSEGSGDLGRRMVAAGHTHGVEALDAQRKWVGPKKCTRRGYPVDVATGLVFAEGLDFELPGPIPLIWSRVWYSRSTHQGQLGHGTPVAVDDGYRNIEDSQVGSLVWAWHEETGDLALQPVVQTMQRESDALVELRVGSDTMRATPEHPLWVAGCWRFRARGWARRPSARSRLATTCSPA